MQLPMRFQACECEAFFGQQECFGSLDCDQMRCAELKEFLFLLNVSVHLFMAACMIQENKQQIGVIRFGIIH